LIDGDPDFESIGLLARCAGSPPGQPLQR